MSFNPRAPCGARPLILPSPCWRESFNPRAPCGARLRPLDELIVNPLVSIHAPRVGRDFRLICSYLCHNNVSIHAPRVGRDVDAVNNALWQLLFQSTRPMRGAT